MKNALLIGISLLTVMGLAGCTGDHTCNCRVEYPDTDTTYVFELQDVTRSQAKKECAQFEASFSPNAVKVTSWLD